MPRDFNAERREKPDEYFEVGYHPNGAPMRFRLLREVAPEALTDFEEMDATADTATAIRVMDAIIESCVWPEDRDQWAQLRSDRTSSQLGLDTITHIIEFVMEYTTGRPPTKPSPSTDGSPNPPTGTPSTAASRLPEVAASPR